MANRENGKSKLLSELEKIYHTNQSPVESSQAHPHHSFRGTTQQASQSELLNSLRHDGKKSNGTASPKQIYDARVGSTDADPSSDSDTGLKQAITRVINETGYRNMDIINSALTKDHKYNPRNMTRFIGALLSLRRSLEQDFSADEAIQIINDRLEKKHIRPATGKIKYQLFLRELKQQPQLWPPFTAAADGHTAGPDPTD